MIEDTAMEAPACEHLWGSHHVPGHRLYWVRQCMICHAVDWDDLDAEIGKLAAKADEDSGIVTLKRPEFSGPMVSMNGTESVRITPSGSVRKGDPGVMLDTTPIRLTGDEALRVAVALFDAWTEANSCPDEGDGLATVSRADLRAVLHVAGEVCGPGEAEAFARLADAATPCTCPDDCEREH